MILLVTSGEETKEKVIKRLKKRLYEGRLFESNNWKWPVIKSTISSNKVKLFAKLKRKYSYFKTASKKKVSLQSNNIGYHRKFINKCVG